MTWILEEARDLCKAIQAVSPAYHAHPALTGGLLYKDGPRKDCDIVIYQRGDTNGVRSPIDWVALWAAFDKIGLTLIHDYGYVKKCQYKGKPVDIFDPTRDSDYPVGSVDGVEAASTATPKVEEPFF